MDIADDDNRPLRRAPVVYGKRSGCNLPSAEERGQSFECAPLPRSPNASDTERSPGLDADMPFQFGFKHRLKELDELFEDHDAQSHLGSSLDNKVVHADLSQSKDLQSVPMGTLSFEVGDLSRSASPLLSSLPSSSTQEVPPDSSPIHLRTRRAQNATLSDSEGEEPSSSSSVSPIRHAITTPHSHSSPTPPTSGETVMVSRKAKGKAPARDVLPLFFDGERPSAAGVASKPKRGRSEFLARPKTKAPTKKERREATFESSRIAASRPVEIIRTEEKKYTLSAFFSTLRRDNIDTPALGTELPSDPIERFSSPTNSSTPAEPEDNMFGAPMGLLRSSGDAETVGPSSSSKSSKALPPAAGDSDDDDEMPSIASIIQQDEKQRKLHVIKQVALRHADTNTVGDNSEDDDLLIVKDDMHSVARQEAVQRRLDKAHGSPVKDFASLRRLNPSVRPVTISPRKLSKQELQEFAKPSFAGTAKHVRGQLNKNQLDQLMMIKHTEESLKSIKRQEEEWVKRGGRLSRDTGGDVTQTSLSQTVEAYAAQGLRAVEVVDANEEQASDDESDEDYTPDLRGSASPELVKEGDMQDDNTEDLLVSQPPGGDQNDDDDDDCVRVALRRSKYGQRHSRVVVGSDDEEPQSDQRNLPAAQRDTASMESQTEDENDKENSAKLMYDRSEDKENKAIARQERSSPELAFGTRLLSLHGVEDGGERNLSLASAMNFSQTIGSPAEDTRSSLKDISKDESDFFSSPPSKSLFTDRLLQSAPRSPPHVSVSTLSLGLSPTLRSERIYRADRLLSDPRIDESNLPESLESLQSQTRPEPSLPSLNLTDGGFSQLFSDEDQGSKEFVGRVDDGLALTLDVGLKPALEIGSTLRRRADIIFEKEQEYVVAAVVQQNVRPKELLYVNDHGFLTQTRPEGSSPQIYRMTPTQATKLVGTQAQSPQMQSPSLRPPLRTLSFTQETSPGPQPLRRLRRRSLSPLEQKIIGKSYNPETKLNAFTILGKAPEPLPKGHEKSEFVAVEAEESDEDDVFGFGGRKGDEEEDNEQDKIVEGLVDDTVMDAETEAAELVQEKFREHEEEDDQRLQKLHEDATKGKFRIKRRGREIGIEYDSDEDEDEDEDERRIRQRIHKKRKIQDDSLEALGQKEETRAFYDSYHQDLIDEDDEFGYLQGDASMTPDNAVPQVEEPQETVSPGEIRRRVREVAGNNHEVRVLDPEDIDWVDRDMDIETDDAVPVKMVELRQSKAVRRDTNSDHIDFDEERSACRAASDREIQQMKSWAKTQGRYQGTGRSGNTTAITGHTRAKSGGGSLRSTQPPKPSAINAMRKTKTASMLSMMSRSDKFS